MFGNSKILPIEKRHFGRPRTRARQPEMKTTKIWLNACVATSVATQIHYQQISVRISLRIFAGNVLCCVKTFAQFGDV